MEKNKLLSLSIIILALSMVFCSLWIVSSIKEGTNKIITFASQENDVLNLDEASTYLKISSVELQYIADGINSEIPHAKINDKYIFSKAALDNWLQSSNSIYNNKFNTN